MILYTLKPNLIIESVKKEGDELKINVVNKGCFDAINLKIEACIVQSDNYTYHLKIDKDDFIILPSYKKRNFTENLRTFKIDDILPSALKHSNYQEIIKKLTEDGENHLLRVRLHANHEYSGFGKAFESKFKWENKFTKIW